MIRDDSNKTKDFWVTKRIGISIFKVLFILIFCHSSNCNTKLWVFLNRNQAKMTNLNLQKIPPSRIVYVCSSLSLWIRRKPFFNLIRSTFCHVFSRGLFPGSTKISDFQWFLIFYQLKIIVYIFFQLFWFNIWIHKVIFGKIFYYFDYLLFLEFFFRFSKKNIPRDIRMTSKISRAKKNNYDGQLETPRSKQAKCYFQKRTLFLPFYSLDRQIHSFVS